VDEKKTSENLRGEKKALEITTLDSRTEEKTWKFWFEGGLKRVGRFWILLRGSDC
jgi:hypothetical protein